MTGIGKLVDIKTGKMINKKCNFFISVNNFCLVEVFIRIRITTQRMRMFVLHCKKLFI